MDDDSSDESEVTPKKQKEGPSESSETEKEEDKPEFKEISLTIAGELLKVPDEIEPERPKEEEEDEI